MLTTSYIPFHYRILNINAHKNSTADMYKKKLLTGDTILKSYRRLYQLVYSQTPKQDANFFKLFKKAFRFFLQQSAHHEDKIDIHFHTIEVAIIAAEKFKLGARPIICILLYEWVRSKKISNLTLEKEFGQSIAFLLKILVKVSGVAIHGLGKEYSKLRYVLNDFTNDNCLVVLIKFADYLHKMYFIDLFEASKQRQIAEETYNIYIPLAHHLGLACVYLELENLYLKFNSPIVYDTITKKVCATKLASNGFLESFMGVIAGLVQEKGIRCFIKGRTKSIASISSKLKIRKVPFDSIYDFYAIRIIFDTTPEREYSDCWAIYHAITSLYEPKITNLRDWISYPKETGYEALHIAVMGPENQWVEVQIRAKRMDEKAEYGEAAHWKYKSNDLGPVFKGMHEKWIENARKFLDTFLLEEEGAVHVNKMYVKP